MSFSISKKIALRYLWSRRGEAFITILTVISIIGVAIGVMVLNIVMAVMTGFEYELKAKLLSTNSHITVRRVKRETIPEWREIRKKIESVEGVESVSAFTYNQALVQSDRGSSGLLIRGIEPQGAAAQELKHYLKGEVLNFGPLPLRLMSSDGKNAKEEIVELPGLIIGKELSKNHLLMQGSPVSILSSNLGNSPFGIVPKFRRFVVSGVYSSGLIEYENSLAYASLDAAQQFFRLGDEISGFEIRVVNLDHTQEIGDKIIEALGGFGSGYMAEDFTQINQPLWEAIRLEKRVYFIVLLLIVIMASFSIISTLVMIVLEKRRDIAVLRTLGATSQSVADIFRIQGAVIGIIGTIAGLTLGYIGCVALREYGFPLDQRVFPISTVPVRMEPLNFILVGIVAFLISALATIYPSRRASKLDPVEILRHE